MTSKQDRVVLLHYHLFKNAGTSIDEILNENFPGKWVTREFSSTDLREEHAREVREWIVSNPDAIAFSSHTCELPPPQIDGVKIVPIIFIREPLDRIVSAYKFERLQQDAGFGSTLARNTLLSGYVEVLLAFEYDRQCRNFHTARFSRFSSDASVAEVDAALQAIQSLPFVGVVHKFGRSLQILEKLVKGFFPHFQAREVQANVTRDPNVDLGYRLEVARNEMGDALFDRLSKVNENDYILFQAALKKLDEI